MLENSRFRGTEFIKEVRKIGRIRHANVLQLVGFCSEGSKQALVYEYMPNGSLAKHLSSKEGRFQSFKWEKLHEFALGIAQGIEYLHKGSDVCILHLEMKPQSVLLDHNFIPKISNAGLAKFYQDCDFVFISTLRGTAGYIAPELNSRNVGAVSSKSEVYNFGMLMLGMSGGRMDFNAKASSSTGGNLSL